MNCFFWIKPVAFLSSCPTISQEAGNKNCNQTNFLQAHQRFLYPSGWHNLSRQWPVMSRSTISMALAAVGLCSLPAFVPGITGSRAPTSSPTLRGTAEGSSTSTFGAAHAAGLALTVLGAAAVKRVSARKALRRELAVAYEDSGIDLLDNGKFAQGLVGGALYQMISNDVRCCCGILESSWIF